MEVGFIGTGTMGQPMAANILAAGNSLKVHDKNRNAASPLVEAGALWCGDITTAVNGCETVLLSLPGPKEVELVAKEALRTMHSGQTLVDMSTNSPALVRELSKLANKKGVEFLDAPVSGGIRGARKGTLAIMVGGDKKSFNKLGNLWECMGSNVFHVGDVGAGNAAKLVNNMLAFSIMMSNAEALVLGAKAGIDPQVLWDIVRSSSGNSMTWEGGARAILRDRLAPTFTVDLACKDIGLATGMAEELGIELEMIKKAEELLKGFQQNGFAKEDVLATVKSMESSAGVKLRGTWRE